MTSHLAQHSTLQDGIICSTYFCCCSSKLLTSFLPTGSCRRTNSETFNKCVILTQTVYYNTKTLNIPHCLCLLFPVVDQQLMQYDMQSCYWSVHQLVGRERLAHNHPSKLPSSVTKVTYAIPTMLNINLTC